MLSNLLDHAIVADDDERHSAHFGVFGATDDERIDIKTAGGEHSGDVCENAGPILNQGTDYMLHFVSSYICFAA